MSNNNEDLLKKYYPHLYPATNQSNSSVNASNTTGKKKIKSSAPKKAASIQPAQPHTGGPTIPNENITIDYIIEEGPKTSVVRDYFRDKIEAINEQNNDDDKEFLRGLDDPEKC
jgi:hypothetical protein